jgi:hypothetical protein
MYVGNALLFSICQMGFPSVLEIYYMFQTWQKNCYELVN